MGDSRQETFGTILGYSIAGVFGLLMLAIGFSKASDGAKPGGEATRALEAYGFTDVLVTSHDAMFAGYNGCSKGDSVYYEATATNPAGKRVDMLVCCGLALRACTVRVK